MEAIFSRANRMMEIHHASQYTVSNSWCIWCIKIRGFALFKNENKKKKTGGNPDRNTPSQMLYLIRVLIAISGDSDRSTTSPYGDKSLSMNPIVRIFIPKHPYLRMESSVRMDKNIRMFGAFHIHETLQTYGCFLKRNRQP